MELHLHKRNSWFGTSFFKFIVYKVVDNSSVGRKRNNSEDGLKEVG